MNPTISNATIENNVVTTPGRVTAGGQVLNKTFRDDVGGLASRWQMQIGLRYLFN